MGDYNGRIKCAGGVERKFWDIIQGEIAKINWYLRGTLETKYSRTFLKYIHVRAI